MDTNLTPEISIITITRDRAGFIAKAVESAQKQSFSNWELIVLDDDSNDDTGRILEAFRAKDGRIRYYKNSPSLGISRNRNLGLSLSKGKYIAILDSDDYWTDNDKLQKQFDFLENNPEYALIGSNIAFVNTDGTLIRLSDNEASDTNIRAKMLTVNQISHSAVLLRKKVLNETGVYDENLQVAEDYDLWLRIGRKYKFANLKETTVNYTVHNGNISNENTSKFYRVTEMIAKKNKNYYPNYWKSIIHSLLRNLTWLRKLRNVSVFRKIKSSFF